MEANLREIFPHVEEIEDPKLRERVVRALTDAFESSTYDSVEEVPWWPPAQDSFDEWKSNATHIRDVTTIAIVLADTLSKRFAGDIDRDTVVAGALLHDISKFHELDGDEVSDLHDWVPHPHYGVHLLAKANLSEHLQHIALSHTAKSAAEPQSIEAQIVAMADRMAVHGVYHEQTGSPAPE